MKLETIDERGLIVTTMIKVVITNGENGARVKEWAHSVSGRVNRVDFTECHLPLLKMEINNGIAGCFKADPAFEDQLNAIQAVAMLSGQITVEEEEKGHEEG